MTGAKEFSRRLELHAESIARAGGDIGVRDAMSHLSRQPPGFDPFWEFVAGPAHAGSFGPNALDNTFGPQVVFQKAPPAGQVNLPPSAGLQFFGQIDIDARSKDLVMQLKDLNGTSLFTQRLDARPCDGWSD